MPWLEGYQAGETYFAILDIQLSDAEGRRAARHQFGSALKQAEEWNAQYSRFSAGEIPVDALPEQPEGYQYFAVIDDLFNQLPQPLSGRERDILRIARKIGYVEAMAERKLWWNLQQAEFGRGAGPAKTAQSKRHHADIRARYSELTGVGDKSDLQARRILRSETGHDLSYLTQILKT